MSLDLRRVEVSTKDVDNSVERHRISQHQPDSTGLFWVCGLACTFFDRYLKLLILLTFIKTILLCRQFKGSAACMGRECVQANFKRLVRA